MSKSHGSHTWIYKTLLVSEADPDEVAAVLGEVMDDKVVYLAYLDEESNPLAVLVPYDYFADLLGARAATQAVIEAQDQE